MIKIKNFINYYYHLYPVEIIKISKAYKFHINTMTYFLYLVSDMQEEINEQVLLNKELGKVNFPSIIVNNCFDKAYSLIEGKWYVLVIYNFTNRRICVSDLANIGNNHLKNVNYRGLDRSDWYTLWCKKIDYFEYQKNYICNKYPLLYNTLDYFIGYAEVAISYINEINRKIERNISDDLVVCHKRLYINSEMFDFYNPFSLILDYKARDIGEYLKNLFFYGYSDEQVKKVLLICNTSFQRHLVMARVLFPSFYFDCYEDIINGVINENEVLPILNKIKDYEDFLLYLYNLLKETDFLIRIDFLERN